MKIFIFLLALSMQLEASTIFRERLMNAQVGDYIVTEAGRITSLLAVRSISPSSVILEEISVPSQDIDREKILWNEWVQNRAPGHTSWSMVEIDLINDQLVECYSFSRAAWVQVSGNESVISTLLRLPFVAVSQNECRRIGPPPPDGELDVRKVWQPPLIENGREQKCVECDVYRALWPRDGSEWAGNDVLFYFDRDHRVPFPIWMQLVTAHAVLSMRVIDSGKDLSSSHREMPRRVPQFLNVSQKNGEGVELFLKSPCYYRQFDLFAIDVTSPDKEIFPITHTLISREGETLHLNVAQSELELVLQENHRYTWLIVPHGHCELYSESSKPFMWAQGKGR